MYANMQAHLQRELDEIRAALGKGLFTPNFEGELPLLLQSVE